MQDGSKLKKIILLGVFVAVFIGALCFISYKKSYSPVPQKELRLYSQQYGYQLWEGLKKFPTAFSLEDVMIGMKISEEGKTLPEEETDTELLKKLIAVRKKTVEKQAT